MLNICGKVADAAKALPGISFTDEERELIFEHSENCPECMRAVGDAFMIFEKWRSLFCQGGDAVDAYFNTP